MPKYAVVKNNGKVVTVTHAQSALEPNWVLITDDRIGVGDTIDKTTGGFISKDTPSTNEQKQSVRQVVKDILRSTDWTQAGDNLNATKQQAWKDYRQALRAAWDVAKVATNPATAMVWPVAPGDEFDGL